MPTSSLIAGIDIGGTNIRCALAEVHAPQRLLVRQSIRTPDDEGPEPVLDRVSALLEDCLKGVGLDMQALAAIGCAAPGITDTYAGIVVTAANLPGWHDIPLADLLEQRFRVPATVENDVNAAALGEYAYGAGQGCHSLVYLTVSTGVAAGTVLEGRIVRGYHHAAGEVGFLVPDPEHVGRDWGDNGCLELTSAGIGLARLWSERRGGPGSPERAIEVFEAARGGDTEAVQLVDRAATYLAQTAIAVATLIDPEVLVLGGSIARNEPGISGRIRDVVTSMLPFPPRVEMAALDDDAPLVGALTLAARQTENLPR